MMADIPIVSFATFLAGSKQEQRAVAQKVYDAFSTIGFIYLTDHGIAQSEIEAIFRESARFFSLPKNTKLNYALTDARLNQGYTADGAEGVNDHKECYEHRRHSNPLCPSESTLPGFATTISHFYSHCLSLALQVLKCLAIALDLGDDDFFAKITTRADPQLRLLHYPSIRRAEVEQPGHSRISAHTDFGLCTLLFQDAIGGLEIDPFHTGEFVAARPVEGACLVNIGDLMMRLTNGRVKSTLHRVVSPQVSRLEQNEGVNGNGCAKGNGDGEEMLPDRYSIPFFVHPDPETLIDPIVAVGEVKKYKPVQAGEWRDYNTRRNYGLDGAEKTTLSRSSGEVDHIEV